MDFEYRKYARVHKSDHPSDDEKGKIHREKAGYAKISGKRDRLSRQILIQPDDEALADSLDELDAAADKIRKNARTHKDRLKKLSQNNKFQ